MNERVSKAVERLAGVRKRFRDLVPGRKVHVCSAAECAPINEGQCLQHGYLAEPLVFNAVYLCRYGNVHICTADHCTRYLENTAGVCPISGIQYRASQQTDYDKGDSRTWRAKLSTDIVARKTTHDLKAKSRSRSALLSSKPLFEEPTPDKDDEPVEEVEEVERVEKEPKAVKIKIKKKRKHSRSHFKTKVKTIIHSLLFSPVRKHFNDEVAAQHKHDYKQAKDRYLTSCKRAGRIPNLIEMMTIQNYYVNLPLPMLNIAMDHTMQDYYVELVLQVWEVVCEYLSDSSLATKINIESVTLGTLYTMRQGFGHKEVEMIPRDPFIATPGVLPRINDITKFGYATRRVTSGEKLIEAAYRRAMEQNVSRESLSVDMTGIEQRKSEDDIYIAVGKRRK